MMTADDAELRRIYDGIASAVVSKGDDYQKQHDMIKQRAVEIYYAFIGRFMDQEGPEEDWQSKLYPKMLKPKILAAWSQFVQAATAAKGMWEVSPLGISTPQASMAAKAMKEVLNEQAATSEMPRKLKSGALDMFLYGTLFWQAPIVEIKTRQTWRKDLGQPTDSIVQRMGKMIRAAKGNPVWIPQFADQDTPSVIHRNYFEMYPWPYSMDIQEGEAIIHRPFLSKYDLVNLKELPGFYEDVIDEILKSEPGSPPSWSLENDRMAARGWSGDTSYRKGYDMLFYAGRLSVKDLKLNQIDGFAGENGRFAEVLAWVINHQVGKKVIKLITNPVLGKHRPFMVAHYEQIPFESLGVGIGENSVDMAKAIGGAIRLFMDGKKMALPMLGINTSYFSGSTKVQFSPFKIWPFDDTKNVKPSDVMFPMQFGDITNGMVEFIEVLERLHDEITGIPKWTTGVDSKMLNKTATGISMIMNASSQLIRGAMENLDDFIIAPTGQRFYDWNMQNNPRPDIKGDFEISASGISSLMQKETLNKQLLGLVSLIVNPQVMQNPYALHLLRMVGDNIGIKDVDAILPNPDKMQEFADQDPRKAAAMLQPSQPSPQDMIRAAMQKGMMKGVEKRTAAQVEDVGAPPALMGGEGGGQ